MTIQALTVQRDTRNIRACRDHDELDGYEAEAKRRGIAPWELAEIDAQRKRIGARRVGSVSTPVHAYAPLTGAADAAGANGDDTHRRMG